MSYIVAQDGKISITEEGMLVPSIIDLYNSDDSKGKHFFRESIKFIYLMADPDSPYINYIESDRLYNVRKEQFTYVSEDFYERIKSDVFVLSALEDYQDKNYDILKRSWEGVKIKIENFMKHLNGIPMEFEVTENVMVDVEVNGSLQRKPMRVTHMKSNNEEYWKALKTYNDVLKFVKAVELDIEKDKKENKASRSKRRIFESEKAQRLISKDIEIIHE